MAVKGTSHYQKAIRTIPDHAIGVLHLEPENPHDENACRILVDGKLVGYLPKGWMELGYGREVVDCLKNGEGVVDLYRVGGFRWENGSRALHGLRVVI